MDYTILSLYFKTMKGSLFSFISSLFSRHNVHAVLVGGYALIANKVQRTTFDVDFLITATDCDKIEPDLLSTGYSIFNRQDAFVQFKSDGAGLRDIDFLITDEHTLEKIIADSTTVAIAGASFFVPSVMHLIEMKLHSISGNKRRGLKDFPDIVQLLNANAIDPKGVAVRNLFKKYSLQSLYERLTDSLGETDGR